MIQGLFITLFTILCFLMIIIILIQKGKSSSGMGGGFGGGAQALFGGSGGQDIFQKITWVMGALFMSGSLALAIMKTKQADESRYLSKVTMPQKNTPALPEANNSASEKAE